jgi:hypothetical protein
MLAPKPKRPLTVDEFVEQMQDYGYEVLRRTAQELHFVNNFNKHRVYPIALIEKIGRTLLFEVEE